MLDLGSIFADGLGGFGKLIAAIPLLKEAGASAAFIGDSEPNNVEEILKKVHLDEFLKAIGGWN